MRAKIKQQTSLFCAPIVKHDRAAELMVIGSILDKNPAIYDMVHEDLTRGVKEKKAGAKGMSSEQVLKAAIIKQMEGYSYEDLAFHLLDSRTYRSFCQIGISDKVIKKSALCNNIKAISDETWEAIHRVIVGYAKLNNVEKGRKARMDCTVVESNIHEPTDSSLLWDSVRVLTRLLERATQGFPGLEIRYTDHTRRAKRRMLGVMNAKSKKVRKVRYLDLIKVCHMAVSYTLAAEEKLMRAMITSPRLEGSIGGIIEEMRHVRGLAEKVIDQTERRVIKGESVPASEKIVSIFESHTDIIVKDRRDTYYGHKICLSCGESNIITDCLILDGNPADSSLVHEMCDRQKEIYGRYPLKVALDGGFTSKSNLEEAKGNGIKDVCFSKGRGLAEEDMCRSKWVYRQLRNFRAGIESAISWLKRSFGLAVCTWKSHRSFKSYVWASIVSANLLTLSRHQLALS